MHFCSHARQEFNLGVEGITCMNSVGKTKFHDDYSVMKWKLIANIIYCQMISRKLEHKIICLDDCCS